jgi:hypothetical protein
MRALSVVLLLVVAAPAFADTPPSPETPPPPMEAAPPPVEAPPSVTTPPPPAEPIRPPALTQPVAPPAVEAPPDGLELPEPPPRKYNYRWQIITADAAAIGMSFAIELLSADSKRPASVATLTIASYFFTAPMVHGAHRQGKRALGSFALRAGLPLLLGLLGGEIDATPECEPCSDSRPSDGKLIGLTAGVLIAMTADSVLFGRPIYRRIEPIEQRIRQRTASWTPALRGVRGGATAGIFGTF